MIEQQQQASVCRDIQWPERKGVKSADLWRVVSRRTGDPALPQWRWSGDFAADTRGPRCGLG